MIQNKWIKRLLVIVMSMVMIGNEANGLSDEAVSVSDMKITITMSGRAESLNAAAAAAIIMWEITRNGGV